MGVFDKIKNALFEVEYVEVDEEESKSKKEDKKKKREEEKEKPIAKKIVLPGKRQDRYQDLHDEDLVDEDFEIEPKKDNVVHEEFKFMDDNDFKMDDDIIAKNNTPEVVETPNVQSTFEVKNEVPVSNNDAYKDNYSLPANNTTTTIPYQNGNNSNKETKAYGMSSSYNVPVHEYGTYDRREERTYFKPSPIISPIYGILDKNYKKEDVKEKKDIRLTSYSRSHVDLDEVRNKAYGVDNNIQEKIEDKTIEEELEDDNLLVDLSDKAKPEVKEITMGDALEYFQDLGLEYNVDYVDASKDTKVTKRSDLHKEEKEAVDKEKDYERPAILDSVNVELKPVEEVAKTTNVVEIKDESKSNDDTISDDDDNLFDLIDSMYQDKE